MVVDKTETPDQTSDMPHTYPIAGIGASAGGPEAFELLFHNIPPNPDMAIFHGVLQLNVPDQRRRQRMPIDAFLRIGC